MVDVNFGDIIVGGDHGYWEHLLSDGTFVQHIAAVDDEDNPMRANGVTFSPLGEIFFALGDLAGVADNDPHDVTYINSTTPNTLAVMVARNNDTARIKKLSLDDGSVLADYPVATDTGWTRDRYLKADSTCDGIIYYTDMGRTIFRFDINTGTQLSNFAQLSEDSPYIYGALKIVETGDVIVAMTESGNGPKNGIALDANGTSFWCDEVNPGDGSYAIFKRLQSSGINSPSSETHVVRLNPANVNDEITSLGSNYSICYVNVATVYLECVNNLPKGEGGMASHVYITGSYS
jgi:hypothetical protein